MGCASSRTCRRFVQHRVPDQGNTPGQKNGRGRPANRRPRANQRRRAAAFEALFLTGARLPRFTLEAVFLLPSGFLRAVLARNFLVLGRGLLDGLLPAMDARLSVVFDRLLDTALTFPRGLVFLALAREGFEDLEGDLVWVTRRLGAATCAEISTTASTSGGELCSTPSVQPWASRTAIMADRMLFHVRASLITALGNMQPSQQTCLNALLD
jgi:hypothetical protein